MSNQINSTTRDEILNFLQDEENITVVPYNLDITEGPESYIVWCYYSQEDEPNEEDPFSWEHSKFVVGKGLLALWKENEVEAQKEKVLVNELTIELKNKFNESSDLIKFLTENNVSRETELTSKLLSDLISKT